MKYEFKRLPISREFEAGPNFKKGKLYPSIDITSLKGINIVDINKYLRSEVGQGYYLTHDWNLFFANEENVTDFIMRFGS